MYHKPRTTGNGVVVGCPTTRNPPESRLQSRQLIVAEVQRGHEGRTGYNEGLKAVPAEVFRLASPYYVDTGILTPNNTLRRTDFQSIVDTKSWIPNNRDLNPK